MSAVFLADGVEVRSAERRVLVQGEPIALGARAFDLLLVLMEHRDRVVGKDELLAVVWPGVEVEENNQPARRLYERMGFAVVGRRERYYQQPGGEQLNALLMRRDLS